MADFQRFEQVMRESLTSANWADRASFAATLDGFPTDNTPTFFRKMDATDIECWLERAARYLANRYPGQEIVMSEASNQVGKDLMAWPSGEAIELKCGLEGSKTDANLGLRTIAYMFGDDPDNRDLVSLMAVAARRDIYRTTADPDERDRVIAASKAQVHGEFESYCGERLTEGEPAPERLAAAARAISRGHTNLTSIRAAIGNPDFETPLLLCVNQDEGFIEYGQEFWVSEAILVDRIVREEGRAALTLRGADSGTVMTLYPHYKNSYHGAGLDIPANAWVKNPCFHIWIGRG